MLNLKELSPGDCLLVAGCCLGRHSVRVVGTAGRSLRGCCAVPVPLCKCTGESGVAAARYLYHSVSAQGDQASCRELDAACVCERERERKREREEERECLSPV